MTDSPSQNGTVNGRTGLLRIENEQISYLESEHEGATCQLINAAVHMLSTSAAAEFGLTSPFKFRC